MNECGPGGLRPSMLPLGHAASHNTESLPVSGETLVSF